MRVTDLLRSMDIFEALPTAELETIAQLLHERRLAASEVLCRQGDAGDAMFIVTGGRIRVSTTDASGNEKGLAYFTDGQFLGEMSMLTGAPRSTTATAETDSELLVLDKAVFDELMSNHPKIMRQMLKVVSQRRMQTNQMLLAEESDSAVRMGSGKVYAVFSPRGGAGKTTLAVNLAARQAVEEPERTALLDLSLTFGLTAGLLGLEPQTSLSGVRSENLADFDRRTLGQYLMRHESGLQLLVSGTRPEEGELVTAAHVRAALGAMKRQFSITFIDCASSFDEPTIAALEMADKIIIVCTPELTTLRDVRECQRVFGEIIRLDLKRVVFVLNYNQPFAVLGREQFESALQEQMAFELPHAGDAAHKTAKKGVPVVLSNNRLAYSKAVEKLVYFLAPPAPKPELKKGARSNSNQTERSNGRHSTGLLRVLRRKRAS